jgi:hypothetical protein
MSTIRPETARVLALLAVGRTIAETAGVVRMPAATVRGLAAGQRGWLIDENGHVYDPGQPGGKVRLPDGFDPALLGWATEQTGPEQPKRQPRTPVPGGVDELLAQAAELDDKTVQALLRKATEHLARLRARVDEIVAQREAEKQRAADLAAAEREIQELQAKLAQVRERAKELGAKPRKTPGKASTAGRGDFAAIRQWAKANGLEVSERGRVAASVIDAYNARNGEA